MNNVTVTYLISLFFFAMYFFMRPSGGGMGEDTNALDYIVSGVLTFLPVYAGYLNRKKNMTYKSVLWIFFINVFLFACSGLFDHFGGGFNILSTGNKSSFVFTMAFIAFNASFYPFILLLDGSGLDFILPLLLSFILPTIGYFIAKPESLKKYEEHE